MRFAADVAGRLTHVLVIGVACCIGAVFLVLFFIGEVMAACSPGWGK